MATTLVDRKQVPEKRTKGILSLNGLETQFHVSDRIHRAVNGVSLGVSPGECLGVIGESGAIALKPQNGRAVHCLYPEWRPS